ncbi:MAG: phenylalanine--tRNA ligase subunit beta, partial [Muribaculaceae bacterium]|nr:phenylalanine--tRNA ligase subunit beta [Muribaculaceae bacterium]
LEVDLTPNRVDAASHYGVARDLSAWLGCHSTAAKPKLPSVEAFKIDVPEGGIKVRVENTEACPRYAGVTIKGVTVKESPEWLKDRLTAVGLRPINNIVDVTNYILLGMGQPLHCFDCDKIAGGEIVVKTCAEGTLFTTLDGVERKLSDKDLMICNAQEPMCIAGVFGGLDSGVTESTTSVFIESAYFNPTSVRKTARRHGLSTDSSFRFERGCDPNCNDYILKLAALMIKELAGGEITGEVVDIYPNPVAAAEVEFNYDRCNALVGKELDHEVVDSILKSLEIEIVSREGNTLTLRVPTYRVDVTRECDVIEDVLRIYGYNNIELTDTLHSSLSFKTLTDSAEDLRCKIAEQLTGQGFNEILNNSLTAESYYSEMSTYPLSGCVRLLNPLSNDLSVMRQTLLFGGLESLSHNINRKAADLKMYEFGNVYFFNSEAESTKETPLAPYREGQRLAMWLTGATRSGNWNKSSEESSIYDLRAYVEMVLQRAGISGKQLAMTVVPGDDLYAVSMAVSTRSGKELGRVGIISKKVLKMFDIRQDVFFAELDWMAIVKLSLKHTVNYTPLPKTLPVRRDLALLLDKNVAMEEVEKVVKESERKLLRDITLFDVYEGKNLPEGKKSYAIAITLQDDEKTLQDKQIEAVMSKVTMNLQKKLGAELR